MAGKVRALPLALAEYELALPVFNPSAILARQLLLKTMVHHSQQVVNELTGEPLQIHEQVADLILEPGGYKRPYVPQMWYQALFDWRYLHEVVRCGEDYVELQTHNRCVPRRRIEYLRTVLDLYGDLHIKLRAWAEYWHLNEIDPSGLNDHFGTSYFKSPALFALYFCSVLHQDITEGWLEAATIPDGLPLDFPHVPSKPFSFIHKLGWSPTSQKRADAAREMRGAFEQQLSQYLDAQEKLAQAQPFLGQAPRTINEDHIKWLVYYHFHRWSYQRVANELTYRDRKSVEQAVKVIAERVGLVLRPPGRGGRPKAPPLSVV